MYAKLHRTAIRVALGLAALGGVSVVNAGYAWPADPAGFSRSGPWGAGPGYAAGANDSTFGRVIHQQNGLKLQVAGRAVTMPVAYRFSQNAPRYAAQVLYLHPGIRTAVGVALWLSTGKVIWDEVEKIWREQSPKGDGYEWRVNQYSLPWSSTKEAACAAYAAAYNGGGIYEYTYTRVDGEQCVGVLKMLPNTIINSDNRTNLSKQGGGKCPAGWTETPAGCLSPALSQPRFEELLNPANQPGWPMPQTVPQELPSDTPLPVEPNPKINPEPGQNPQHRPMFVPTGDPVPNPNYDPNSAPGPNNRPWIQPGVRLNPSPTVNDPWRIDVQPVDRPKEDGNPLPGPESETNPDTGKDDKPKPEERPGLCDEYPDILACQKPELDTPDDEIPKTTKDVSYLPDNLFGGGSCPANKTMNIAGQQMTVWDWDASCGYIQNYMRPVILVLCAFAAFVIVSGGTRQ